jgi:UDP-glucose-4-epimerase GalE
MKVLVTGGAGYIGSHACAALAERGHEVVVFDNLEHGRRDFVQWGGLVVGELCKEASIATALAQTKPDAVMHFAGLIQVGESVTSPAKYYRNNVAGSINLIEAMRAQGVDKLIFSSTAAVYGTPERSPIPEDHPLAPINPYGLSKLMVEQILKDCDHAFGLKHVCLRYFNAAGADPQGRIGEAHVPETHVIPLALEAAYGDPTAFKIFGTDYPSPDGTAIRDYIHVVDLVDAHVRALEHLMSGGASAALNLGTGAGVTVREIISAVERVTGRTLRPKESPRRAGDPPSLVADPRRANALLGWTPKRSDLDTIIADAWAWRLKQGVETRQHAHA